MGEGLLVPVDGTVQTAESGSSPQLVLVAEVGLVGDFIGVQLVVAVGVKPGLHQIAAVLAVGPGGLREELEEVAIGSAVDIRVAEGFGPEDLVGIEVLVEVVIPTPLQQGSVVPSTPGKSGVVVAVVVDVAPARRVLVGAVEVDCNLALVEGADVRPRAVVFQGHDLVINQLGAEECPRREVGSLPGYASIERCRHRRVGDMQPSVEDGGVARYSESSQCHLV